MGILSSLSLSEILRVANRDVYKAARTVLSKVESVEQKEQACECLKSFARLACLSDPPLNYEWFADVLQKSISRTLSAEEMTSHWPQFISCLAALNNEKRTEEFAAFKEKLCAAYYARLKQDSDVHRNAVSYYAENFPDAAFDSAKIPLHVLQDVLNEQRLQDNAWLSSTRKSN